MAVFADNFFQDFSRTFYQTVAPRLLHRMAHEGKSRIKKLEEGRDGTIDRNLFQTHRVQDAADDTLLLFIVFSALHLQDAAIAIDKSIEPVLGTEAAVSAAPPSPACTSPLSYLHNRPLLDRLGAKQFRLQPGHFFCCRLCCRSSTTRRRRGATRPPVASICISSVGTAASMLAAAAMMTLMIWR